MNSKKILLLTTLIASLVLIAFVAFFSRFILNIDFGSAVGQTNASVTEEEEKQEEANEQQPEEETSGEQTSKEESDNKEEKEDEDKKEEDKDEKDKEEAFETSSTIKTASITVEAKENSGELTVDDAEKLTELLKEINALKLMSVAQSVGMQDASWNASLNLSMADGTAISCNLYESTLSGSKTTLSTGSKTYESTESVSNIKKLLESWMEEEQKANGLNLAADQFEQATRVLTANPFTLEVQDIASSKSALQQAMSKLKVTETYTDNVHPGVEYSGTNLLNLADDTNTLFTFEFYETGILAYRSENSKEFYACEEQSLKTFYQTVEQICSQYAATPAHLAMMDYGALSGMQASSTTGTSRKEVGLIREHAQNLFYFLQQVHVSKGSMKEESAMFNRPEYHVDIEFDNGTVYGVDINKGSLLVQVGDGSIYHYTLVGDNNLELLRAELERVTTDD